MCDNQIRKKKKTLKKSKFKNVKINESQVTIESIFLKGTPGHEYIIKYV